MSIGEKGICVRILEKEFRVACPKSQEQALRDAAQYLDKQMKLIRQSGRVIGIERIAVMAALNIANELLSLKNTAFEPDEAFSERLKVLQDKIDNVLAREHTPRETVVSERVLKEFEVVEELEETV
ncbi:MAG: cell division protein ZapA [Proteobacteria bacterium]|nr:cell division protein ZapA [Pseudomonadota bacterium]